MLYNKGTRRTGLRHLITALGIWMSMLLPAFGLYCYAAEDGSSLKASKKVISVVYDDSGSMFTTKGEAVDKWAQANYAMQAFAALLNDQDEMYITYMSDAKKVPKDGGKKEYSIDASDSVALDMKNVEQSVEQIRKKTDHGSTPVQAVDAAMDKLRSIRDPDENTQYWLVVLTDGKMFTDEEGGQPSTVADVQDKLDKFVGEQMPNGSPVYITYLGIGGDAQELKGNSAAGFDARKTTDIVDALSEIANKVSGRMVFKGSDLTQVNDTTLKVHTDIPLYSISVFSQRSNAEVKETRGVSNVRNIALKYPESPNPDKYITNTDLYGNAALSANSDGSLIQAGDYEIVFSEKVSLKNTVIMYQPAIQMVPSVTKNGAKLDVKDLGTKLSTGDKIDIELIPTNPETGETIDDSLLPDGIQWSIDYQAEGNQTAHSDSRILKNVDAETGENTIICVMKIPDMTPQNDSYDFRIDKPTEYGFSINEPEDAVYKRAKMGRKNGIGTPISMQLTADGAALNKKDLKKISISVSDISLDDSNVSGSFFETSGWKMASTGTGKLKDGSYTVYPKWTALPFLIKPGEYHFKVKAVFPDGSSQETEASYTVIGHWTDWLAIFVLLAVIALFLYIVVGLIILKPKFHGQHVVVKVYESDGGKGGILHPELSKSETLHSFRRLNDFTPFASAFHIGSIKIVASSGGGILINKGTLKRYVKAGTSSRHPQKQFAKLIASLEAMSDMKKGGSSGIPEEQYIGTDPFYLYSAGGLLYAVYIE